MGPEGIAFWGTAAIPALGPFLINLVVRGKEVMKSSGADFLLLLLALDLTATLTATEFAKFIPDPTLRQVAIHLALGAALVTLAIWFLVVKYLEPVLNAGSQPTSAQEFKLLCKKIGAFTIIWATSAVLIVFHIYVFFHKEPG